DRGIERLPALLENLDAGIDREWIGGRHPWLESAVAVTAKPRRRRRGGRSRGRLRLAYRRRRGLGLARRGRRGGWRRAWCSRRRRSRGWLARPGPGLFRDRACLRRRWDRRWCWHLRGEGCRARQHREQNERQRSIQHRLYIKPSETPGVHWPPRARHHS